MLSSYYLGLLTIENVLNWAIIMMAISYLAFYAFIVLYCIFINRRNALYIHAENIVFLHPKIFSAPMSSILGAHIDNGSLGLSWWGDVVLDLKNGSTRRIQCGLATESAEIIKKSIEKEISEAPTMHKNELKLESQKG